MKQWTNNHNLPTGACFCVGPQNGQPLCPCRMRGVKIKNGRYVQPEKDLGPVTEPVSTMLENININTVEQTK